MVDSVDIKNDLINSILIRNNDHKYDFVLIFKLYKLLHHTL